MDPVEVRVGDALFNVGALISDLRTLELRFKL